MVPKPALWFQNLRFGNITQDIIIITLPNKKLPITVRRGRWTPGTGASSPRPRTGPGPPVSGDWAGRNSNLTRGGLSGSVALCADFDEGSLAGPLMGWGQVPAGGSLRAPRRPTNHCLWYPAWFVLFPFTLSRYPQAQWHTLNGSRFQMDTGRSSLQRCKLPSPSKPRG
jgi:hypothetical protein